MEASRRATGFCTHKFDVLEACLRFSLKGTLQRLKGPHEASGSGVVNG